MLPNSTLTPLCVTPIHMQSASKSEDPSSSLISHHFLQRWLLTGNITRHEVITMQMENITDIGQGATTMQTSKKFRTLSQMGNKILRSIYSGAFVGQSSVYYVHLSLCPSAFGGEVPEDSVFEKTQTARPPNPITPILISISTYSHKSLSQLGFRSLMASSVSESDSIKTNIPSLTGIRDGEELSMSVKECSSGFSIVNDVIGGVDDSKDKGSELGTGQGIGVIKGASCPREAISEIISLAEEGGRVVSISCYEIHHDHAYDLLDPKHPDISVLEDGRGNVKLKGLSQVVLSHKSLSYKDVRRKSSDGPNNTESAKINKSLYAIQNVIHALNANEGHIPYRESKVTRVLQDSDE
ncbi:Kinesin motor domain [Dillenia turbinata]|uniref:Kinesin motor domain n=1 Tax=Dillenia turbinata TaxID=194707 RepID=A0AAN8VZ00_9MAGN